MISAAPDADADAHHGQAAILDLLDCHVLAVHARRVKGELVDEARLHTERSINKANRAISFSCRHATPCCLLPTPFDAAKVLAWPDGDLGRMAQPSHQVQQGGHTGRTAIEAAAQSL